MTIHRLMIAMANEKSLEPTTTTDDRSDAAAEQ